MAKFLLYYYDYLATDQTPSALHVGPPILAQDCLVYYWQGIIIVDKVYDLLVDSTCLIFYSTTTCAAAIWQSDYLGYDNKDKRTE